MSTSSSDRTDLETVINWPLLGGALALALALLTVPIVLTCLARWAGDPATDRIALAPTPPPSPQATARPAARPAVSVAQAEPPVTPRQVYVRGSEPPIPPDPPPIRRPTARATAPEPPPARNPILQFPEEKRPICKRLDEVAEAALLQCLAEQAVDVDLESVKGTREKLLAAGRKDTDRKNPAILALRTEREDLRGLPMREGADCQASREATQKMQRISTTIRRTLSRRAPRSASRADEVYRAEEFQDLWRSSKDWFEDDGLSTQARMLQVEDVEIRCQFTRKLHAVKSAKASVLLARQALFDPSWSVREESIRALRDRPRQHYRQVLLDGLRYPWPPVAAHAAETLVAVDDQQAVFPLADLLDAPDPCAPSLNKDNKWVVPQMVRINHLRNCLLCHAPSTAASDPVRGLVPTPGQRLPEVYYESRSGDFVRADVTYLRQDFSLVERVAKPDKWPEWQRFDYLIRLCEVTAEERRADERKRAQSRGASYPQREAVLFALRELSGLNAGENSSDWYEAFDAEAFDALAAPAPR